jgi:nitrate reductase NapE component
MNAKASDDDHVLTKRGERRVFIFIAVFLFPALSIDLVGGLRTVNLVVSAAFWATQRLI